MRKSVAASMLAAITFNCAQVQAGESADAALQAAVAGDWRSTEARARDQYRHPVESLSFWGLKPGMTILEMQPGGASWWTEILAPYARMTGGTFYVTGTDISDPNLPAPAREGRAAFEARYANAAIYGKVNVIGWGGPQSAALPANTFDFILTARSVHGWLRAGIFADVLKDMLGALKPGGILALEQHRAHPGPYNPDIFIGYIPEAYVIEQAQKAGFELLGQSEINANPKDTKDHPFGVWTLPPTRATASPGPNQSPNPDFDHSKYDAIGESDRMTLKFRKPVR